MQRLVEVPRQIVKRTPFGDSWEELFFFNNYLPDGFHDEFHFAVHALCCFLQMSYMLCLHSAPHPGGRRILIVFISLIQLLNTFLIKLLHAISELFCTIIQIFGTVFQIIYTVGKIADAVLQITDSVKQLVGFRLCCIGSAL